MANKNKQGVAETFDASQSSEAFFSKNKKVILGSVAALVLIVAGFFLYKSLVAGPREEKASTALAKGQEYFNQEQFDKALNGDGAGYVGFARIADDYSSTDAGNLANLYAGLCNANLDKWEAAKKFLDAYAHLNDLDKAVDNLKKAAKLADGKDADGANSTLSPLFLIQAGEILESQGKKEEALAIYQDIKKKYVNSILVQSSEIDKYVERASTK